MPYLFVLNIPNLNETKGAILDCIKVGNTNRINMLISRLFDALQINNISSDPAQRICFELVISYSVAMGQLGYNPETIFKQTNIWDVLNQCHSLNELKDMISDITYIACSMIADSRENKAQYQLQAKSGTGEAVGVLYNKIALDTITNVDNIDKIYIVSGISNSGSSKPASCTFKLNECEEFSSTTFKNSNNVAVGVPATGKEFFSNSYKNIKVAKTTKEGKFFDANILHHSSTTDYVKLDVTDYLKPLIANGQTTLYFNMSVSKGTSSAYVLGTSMLRLYVTYKTETVTDNPDGTMTFDVIPSDYTDKTEGTINVVIAKYDGDNKLTAVNINPLNVTENVECYNVSNDSAKTTMFVWDDTTTLIPLAPAVTK